MKFRIEPNISNAPAPVIDAESAQAAIDKYLADKPYLVIGCETSRAVERAPVKHEERAPWKRYWVHGVREDGSLAASPLEYFVTPDE